MLFTNESFRIIAYTLTWSYVLLMEVANDIGARRVMKFSYEERPVTRPRRDAIVDQWVADEQRSTELQRLKWRARQGVRALGRALGWAPRRFIFPCAAVAYGYSYHFEVEAPRGALISSGALFLTTFWSPRRNPYKLSIDDSINVLERRRSPDDWEKGSLRRSHLNVRETPDTGQGLAEVNLRPERNTFLQGMALTALLALALLGAGLHFRSRLTDVEAGTTLLLLLPTVLVVYVVQPSAEHAMAARLITAIRAFGILVGLCLVGASGSLIVARKGAPPSRLGWELAVYIAAAATVVLAGAWIQARPRKYRSSDRRDHT
jgi:hypothetical protein